MSFLKIFSNPTTRLICLEFLFLTSTALPALADMCSNNPQERVPLPACVRAEYTPNGGRINNLCNHKVTIKVDVANRPDQRLTVNANGGSRSFSTGGRFKLSCCPKYNKCG